MDTKALHQWAELLLDTGKRNHLINFRASRTGTAEIVAPDFDALFRQAEHAAVLEVFDPKTEKEDSELFERAFSLSDSEKARKQIRKCEKLSEYRSIISGLFYNNELC